MNEHDRQAEVLVRHDGTVIPAEHIEEVREQARRAVLAMMNDEVDPGVLEPPVGDDGA